jgi:DNA modification methylase
VIIEGDARTCLTALDGGLANIVVTSPPYFGLRDYGVPGEIGAELHPDDYVKALIDVLDGVQRILAPDGSVFLVVGDKYARTGGVDRKVRGGAADPGGRVHARPVQRGVAGVKNGSLIGLPFRLALAAVDAGWVWRQEIVWHKPNPLPESVRNRSQRSHETILHLSRTNQPYCRNIDGGRFGHDVWEFPVGSYRDPLGRKHPAVFPEPLVERILTDYCPPGGHVLDPFAGSGTTCAVARRAGLRWTGIELNPEYAQIARMRCAL